MVQAPPTKAIAKPQQSSTAVLRGHHTHWSWSLAAGLVVLELHQPDFTEIINSQFSLLLPDCEAENLRFAARPCIER